MRETALALLAYDVRHNAKLLCLFGNMRRLGIAELFHNKYYHPSRKFYLLEPRFWYYVPGKLDISGGIYNMV